VPILDNPSPYWLAPILLAPFIGSFLGTLILRLPDNRPIVWARSACDHCGHPLGPTELIPLVSFALARGCCRHCGQPIGRFHLGVEVAALAAALWAVTATADDMIWWSCAFAWTLLVLAWIDLRTMLLPDVLTLPLIVLGLIMTWVTDTPSLLDHCLAAILGYTVLHGIAWAWKRFRGREGLGLGDAKLLAALGAWLGLAALPSVLFLSACLGLAAAGAAALTGRAMTRTTAIPFGPCLALAGWLAWLYFGVFDDWLAGVATPFG
jgi:leader peptidase (prepilin peptidase)/N-methyltransferase